MQILVVNTGSSSLKLAVLGPDDHVVAGDEIDGWDGDDLEPIAAVIARAPAVDAVAHRVVHGGGRSDAAVVDDDLRRRLQDLILLAPLHQGRALEGIRAAQEAVPDVPHVACFDTAYHATMPDAAATYALPAEWRERWPCRRFGFHGLSHAYAVRRAAELLADRGDVAPPARVVSCHLGAGASLCASLDGRSVDTTMGFTPLEGLVMASRSGSVDPGLVLWLVTEAGLTAADVRTGLEHASGLAGLAGADDMRVVLDRRRRGDDAARLAFDVYVHSLRRHIAAMTASLGGLDVLVFTGGVGERSPDVRTAAVGGLAYLGLAVDPARNLATGDAGGADATGDRDISAEGAAAATLVIEAREDLDMARQTRALLNLRH